MKEKIIKVLTQITGLKPEEIHLETPEREEFGDYSSNIAMALFSKSKARNPKQETKLNVQNSNDKKVSDLKNMDLDIVSNLDIRISDFNSSRELAEAIKNKLIKLNELTKLIEKVEVAGPGFINFWLSRSVLASELREILEKGSSYGESDIQDGKRYLLEHTSPNTIKTLHVGHVRNNVLGMALHNLLEHIGADVKLDAINNDRGIHVMKAVWAYIKFGEGSTPESNNEKPDHFVDKFYVLGAKNAEENQEAKEEMQELLRKWEAGDNEIRSVWKTLRDWTFEGFKESYKRLGSRHDHQWFESDFYEHGKEMVEEGLKKGVFKKLKDGAVLSNLKKFGLSDTIVIRADGTSMYHTQDLYLTKLKKEKFPSDLYIWDIGPEQELYLKQLFAMCEQLGIGKGQIISTCHTALFTLRAKEKCLPGPEI